MNFKPRYLFRYLAIVGLAFFMSAPDGYSDDNENYRRFILPARVDEGYVASSITIACPSIEYGMAFSEFQKVASNEFERVFVRLINAMRIGDRDGVLSMTITGASPESVNGFINIIKKTEDEIVVRRMLHIGRDVVFVWEITNNDDRSTVFSRWFRWTPTEQGVLAWDGGRQDVLMQLLSFSFQKAIAEPEKYANVESRPGSYRLAMGSDTSGYPAYLEFNGEHVHDFNALVNQGRAPSPLLDVYRDSWLAITNGQLEAQAGFYTPRSADKYRQWVAKMDDTRRSAYLADIVRTGKDVVFVLDGDPVYYVFTRTHNNKSGAVKHDVVFRDSETGRYRLTSFYFESFLDKLFRDELLFVKPAMQVFLEKD